VASNTKGRAGASPGSVLLFFAVVSISILALDYYQVIGEVMVWGAAITMFLLGLVALL
jgi:hypothetical protein